MYIHVQYIAIPPTANSRYIHHWSPVVHINEVPLYTTVTTLSTSFSQHKTVPLTLTFSGDGKLFAAMAADRKVCTQSQTSADREVQ